MRDEISAGIKNALERGYSLEEAIQSLINAGYNPVEVREAANNLTSGATSIINPQSTGTILATPNAPQQSASAIKVQKLLPQNQNSQNYAYMPPRLPVDNKSSKKKIIFLIGVLAFLIMILILFIIYKDQIITALKK